MPNNKPFSARHPFLFGMMLITVAIALLIGGMATFSFFTGDDKGSHFEEESLAQVNITGFIADPMPVLEFLHDVQTNDQVRGVLLRVNSGGGAVAPSQEIYRAVKNVARIKPVVASFSTVAASGGYYVAAPAEIIVANPATLTGSIGVKAELPNFKGLMDKIGVSQQIIASGKLKGTGSPFQPLTPEQEKYLKELVMDMHRQFVADVAESRNMTVAEVEKVADGRALTGSQARDAGLVDRLGGYYKALSLLRTLANVSEDVPVVEGPVEEKPLLVRLLGGLGFTISWDGADGQLGIMAR